MNYKTRLHVQALSAQRGLTLIELTVVLLVLIGLAGLLIPYVGGFMDSTHNSTSSSSSAEIDGLIQRYQTQYLGLPNNLESLIVETAGTTCTTTGLYCKLDADFSGMLTSTPLTATTESSLKKSGVTSVYNANGSTDNATFEAVAGTTTTLAATVPLPVVTGTSTCPSTATASIEGNLCKAFGRPASEFNATCYDYVALGVGDTSAMSGKVLTTAPVHFGTTSASNPVNQYGRFVAILQVDKSNAPGCSDHTEAAKFIGTVMPTAHDGHLWGTAHTLGHTYENMSKG